MTELSKEQALELYDSGFWHEMTPVQIAEFQFFTKRLCMPFAVFHKAMEVALDRSVWTHEFGMNYDGLKKELLGEKEAPTMQEIIDLIPESKRIIL